PKDVTASTCEYIAHDSVASMHSLPNVKNRVVQTAIPKEKLMQDVAQKINQSIRPVILCGGGVISSNSTDELKEFAEKANIPVVTTLMGKSAFPNTHLLFAGLVGMHGSKAANMAIDESDLVIAIGTRFSDRITGDVNRFAKKSKVVHIDIDPQEISKNIIASERLVGNIKYVLSSLLGLVKPCEHSQWVSQIEQWKSDVPDCEATNGYLTPKFIYECVKKNVLPDTIISTEVGQHQMWAAQFYNFEMPRTFLTSGGLGTMGFGFGAAIGAKFANPTKTVINFAGDGSFLMNCNELATLRHYNLPVVIIILNNGTLGMVRQWQTLFYEKHYSATTLDYTPDFVRLAESHSIKSMRVENETDFEKVLKIALQENEPFLIDCKIDIDQMVLPMIPPGKSVEDLVMSLK
ncbi:MAG: acetolactate synthase large subunit, partial [Treponema sp.]|nr:acetolactate synthase large subunit [Treponema sp.]